MENSDDSTYLLALSLRPIRPGTPVSLVSTVGLAIESIGRGSVGPEIVGRRLELDVLLVLTRGCSTGLWRELLDVRVNHLVGRDKKLPNPEGDAERANEGSEGDCFTLGLGLMLGWRCCCC